MPANPDSLEIVQVEKQESTALGGDDADAVEYGSAPINPLEDIIESAGLVVHDTGDSRPNRDRAIWADGNDLRFRDKNVTGSGKTLTELAGGAAAADPAWRRHFLLMGA